MVLGLLEFILTKVPPALSAYLGSGTDHATKIKITQYISLIIHMRNWNHSCVCGCEQHPGFIREDKGDLGFLFRSIVRYTRPVKTTCFLATRSSRVTLPVPLSRV